LVVAFLIGCAFLLLVVGCSGTSSETSNKKEKGHSPEATASKEEARCEGTRTTKVPPSPGGIYTTNDLPSCPKGGLLLGTNGKDKLFGGAGDDEIRGLGAKDDIAGGDGNDVIYAGPGNESFLWDGKGDDVIYGGDGDDELGENQGDDVIYGGDGDDYLCCAGSGKDVQYGGDGNDFIEVTNDDGQPDKFYCGKGKDRYGVNENFQMPKNDYVDSSCEKKVKIQVVV
jgi:hypothetical protein